MKYDSLRAKAIFVQFFPSFYLSFVEFELPTHIEIQYKFTGKLKYFGFLRKNIFFYLH